MFNLGINSCLKNTNKSELPTPVQVEDCDCDTFFID